MGGETMEVALSIWGLVVFTIVLQDAKKEK